MILTKKYRLWWNLEKIIENDYLQDYSNSVTYGSNPDFTYFESDNFTDIEQKIISENLIINPEA